MGQDLKQFIEIHYKNSPLGIYESFFLFIKPINGTNKSLKVKMDDNLEKLCSRFSDGTYKKALQIDNIDRIKLLDFIQYIYFIHFVIIKTDNVDFKLPQIFNSKDYNFLFYLDNLCSPFLHVHDAFENVIITEIEDFQMVEIDSDSSILHKNISTEIINENKKNPIDFFKNQEVIIVNYILEIENKLIELINSDCMELNTPIESSNHNHKWQIVYSLGELRTTIQSMFHNYKPILNVRYIEEMTHIFEIFYEYVTKEKSTNFAENFVNYLLGLPSKEPFRYIEDIFIEKDRYFDDYTIKENLIAIFYFLYKKGWFINVDNLEKGDFQFSKSLSMILNNKILGCSEPNIRWYLTKISEYFKDPDSPIIEDFEIPFCEKINAVFREYSKL